MDLPRHLRSLALLVFILASYFSSATARHAVRHQHDKTIRLKRQHGDEAESKPPEHQHPALGQDGYVPASYVWGGPRAQEGAGSADEWGPWSASGPCSRSCGGGVASQTRRCMGYRCSGADLRYFSCNIQDCPPNAVDFRAEQCTEFDSQLFEGRYYTWVPYTKAPNQCELHCMPKGERFYYRHRRKVADGTHCDEERQNICVDGQCMPVGCDLLLGSRMREDQCRECGGDGTGCTTYSKVFEINDLQAGYNDILLIPAGSTNIKVREVKSSNNYLAVRNTTGHYYINGNWRIDYPRSFYFAGSIFHYERKSDTVLLPPESLSALGPTTEDLYIVLLYQEPGPGLQYEYSVPQGVASRLLDPDSYAWQAAEFSPCSATCGGGYQVRRVSCARKRDMEMVANGLCNTATMPAANQTCAPEPCPPGWLADSWGPCSESCGANGTRTRQVYCGQIMGNGLPSVVDEATCKRLGIAKPPTSEQCGTNDICPTWHVGAWKPCDKLCGIGKKTREVVCFIVREGRKEILSDNYCQTEKPAAEEECSIRPCEGVDWVTSPWSGCEDSCGLVTETRKVHCANKEGKLYDNEQCQAYRKPETERDCLGGGACEYEWFASQWSKCSSKCGPGIRTRKVFCSSWENDTLAKAEDDKCDPELKYSDTEECIGNASCKGEWFVGPWSECSKRCGGGETTRKVLCILNNQTVAITECDADAILSSSESCNKDACGEDETLSVSASPTTTALGPEEVSTIESMSDDDCLKWEWSWDRSNFVTIVNTRFGLDDGSDESTEEPDTTASPEATTVSSATEPSASTVADSSTEGSGATDASSATGPSLATEGSSATEASSGTKASSGTEASSGTKATSGTEASSGTGATEASSGTESSAATVSAAESSAGTDASAVPEMSTTSEPGATDTIASTAGTDSSTTDGTMADAPASDPSTTDSSTTDPSTTTDPTTTDPSTTDPSTTADSTTEDGTTAVDTTTAGASTAADASTPAASVTTDAVTTDAPSTDMTGASSEAGFTDVSTEAPGTAATVTAGTASSAGATDTTGSGATEGTDATAASGATDATAASEATEATAATGATESTSDSAAVGVRLGDTEDSSATPASEMTDVTTSAGGTTSAFEPWGTTTSATLDRVTNKKIRGKCLIWRRKKPDPELCKTYDFGCCWDNETEAKGPFGEGCPEAKTCNETKFGCCPDDVSPADGPNKENCPESLCAFSLFGCCQDNSSYAEGNNFEGCPEPETVPFNCNDTEFGCCPDLVRPSQGWNNEGCFECEGSGECNSCKDTKFGCCPQSERAATGLFFQGCEGLCEGTKYGCCPDNKTPAKGKKNKGCPKAACTKEKHGCCADGVTPAHGPDQLGCCINTEFGCCQDNMTPAKGANHEGCTCENTKWGCCPDNYTIATGKNNSGCGCRYTEHGCCPDGTTVAPKPGYEGCPCWTYQFGCCADGETVARGPNEQGCGCQETQFGCCEDGVTAARGPGRGQGCECVSTRYGCCPDGSTTAIGPRFEGCDDKPFNPTEACTLDKDLGTCRNFTVRWFFDKEYGDCSRFWYGGCDGNGNRFRSQEECKDVCVQPSGRDVCTLPKIKGPCDGYFPTWYYDADRGQCGQFIYGGCLGNANRFNSHEECNSLCVPEAVDACSAPVEPGPCNGSFPRWAFDKETRSCRQFSYGGCQGNKNSFLTEAACLYKCNRPGESREVCALPREAGECPEKIARWSFDASENRCVPFYHSGCGGNGNTFTSRETCEQDCPRRVAQDVCLQPALTGECHNYTERWYYDALEGHCKQFYYGNCGGNHNNFRSREECQQRCERGGAPPPPAQPQRPPMPEQPQPQPAGPELTVRDICFMPEDPGRCQESVPRWRYDRREGICRQFMYSGCEGNRNNFESREDCERSCANVQDPCELPKVEGPCRLNQRSFYYNARSDQCEQFYYGGCQGNANRFREQAECEQRCVRDPNRAPSLNQRFGDPEGTPQAESCRVRVDPGPCNNFTRQYYFDDRTNECQPFDFGGCGGSANRFVSEEQCNRLCGTLRGQDVCSLPYETGRCRGSIRKWFFDTGVGICREFVYGGCGGNGNRFSSDVECTALCVQHFELPPEGSNASAAGQPDQENAVDVGDRCEAARRECGELRCPYGVAKMVDATGCEVCECYNPCKDMRCPPDQRCGIELVRANHPAASEPSTNFGAVCRLINKPGECPAPSLSSACTTDCRSDADCSGDAKCCYTGCGQSCVNPASDALPVTSAPFPPRQSSEDLVRVEEPQVTASEGGYATLRCIATGYPLPSITWRKDSVTIDGIGGRHKILTDGSLQIIGLVRTDSGIYLCIADNGVAPAVTKEFRLDVTDPVPQEAQVIGDLNAEVLVTLGEPAHLQCYAYGYPAPYITWWRADRMLPLTSEQYEQRQDHSLIINHVDLHSLGPYTCQAYNGRGKANSWTVTVKAVGNPVSSSPEDIHYHQYLVAPDQAPARPAYPVYTQAPAEPAAPVTEEPRTYIAPVQTNISTSRREFPVDGDVSIPCQVEGHPIPRVSWYKDGVHLEPSDRVRISDANRLEVLRAGTNDSGTYRCEAANQYSSHWSEVTISVTGTYIHPNCTDNPFFANCKLIVRAQYCTHQYYARFCCRSCTSAGQLPSIGPHLYDAQQEAPQQGGRYGFGRRRRSLARRYLSQLAFLN